MERIASFTIDHRKLLPGLYVSRQDKFGPVTLSTFDLRFKRPNQEPVMDQPTLHTIEHLGATYLRNNPEWKERVVYFGPMGCRTGFYTILEGELDSRSVLPLIIDMLKFIEAFEGEIPGASEAECGNFREQNLPMAKWEARHYLAVLENADTANLTYPE
jgi:S-ribosylhomocysteine lyase